MKLLSTNEVIQVSGGEIVPGWPTPEMMCLNVKLMVSAGRGEPGFDITAAVRALMRACNGDFWDQNQAHEYVVTGAYP